MARKKATRAKQKPVDIGHPKSLAELGDRFIALGEALKDENTLIRRLSDLSLACGMEFHISIVPKDKPGRGECDG